MEIGIEPSHYHLVFCNLNGLNLGCYIYSMAPPNTGVIYSEADEWQNQQQENVLFKQNRQK